MKILPASKVRDRFALTKSKKHLSEAKPASSLAKERAITLSTPV